VTITAARPSTVAPVSFKHLFHLTDRIGLFEHAERTTPRQEDGYRVDDAARALVVVAREAHPSEELTALATTYLHFVLDAQGPHGGFRNRRTAEGVWSDEPSVDDCWGRALWSLGTAVARAPGLADWRALGAFTAGAQLRSPSPRSMAFAGLGAAEVLTISPLHVPARTLLGDAARLIAGPTLGMGIAPTVVPGWRWPEPRLHYANAVLADTLIAAGSLLGVWKWLTDGLGMLAWLLETETSEGHLSPTPAHGWAQGEPRPAFDQRPMEVAALADACSRALDVTADPRWRAAVQLCADWFDGANDLGISLRDPASGGGCDGLQESGRNENQGAESTISLISTLQQAQRVRASGG
jgi:hypothetical protein